MTHRHSAATRSGLALLVCILAAMPAMAQEKQPPKAVNAVTVIDVQLIISKSLATKSIRPQFRKLKSSYENEIKRRELELLKAKQDLIGQRVILSPEAFAERRIALQKRADAVEKSLRKKKWIIDRAIARTMGKFNRELRRIVVEMDRERPISPVFVKSAVFHSAEIRDITAEALQRLNKRLPRLDVSIPKKK